MGVVGGVVMRLPSGQRTVRIGPTGWLLRIVLRRALPLRSYSVTIEPAARSAAATTPRSDGLSVRKAVPGSLRVGAGTSSGTTAMKLFPMPSEIPMRAKVRSSAHVEPALEIGSVCCGIGCAQTPSVAVANQICGAAECGCFPYTRSGLLRCQPAGDGSDARVRIGVDGRAAQQGDVAGVGALRRGFSQRERRTSRRDDCDRDRDQVPARSSTARWRLRSCSGLRQQACLQRIDEVGHQLASGHRVLSSCARNAARPRLTAFASQPQSALAAALHGRTPGHR